MINITTNEISDYVTVHDENHVHLGSDDLTFYKGNHAVSSHNHVGLEPFNYEDFHESLKHKGIITDAMIVHTPQDIFIVEFNENAKYHMDEIVNASYNDFEDMMERKLTHPSEAFGAEALWDNYLKDKILNKYMKFRRISK